MFRPSHPRVMNYRPRFNIQQNFQWRRPPVPRAFFGKLNDYASRPPHLVESRNLEHWCETCDRGFASAIHLKEHTSQHQKCNIDGCQFVAHPKVITKHIQMQHSSGLYKKISNLNNPVEINKWREERKRNFPTRSNIEKKAAELKEKIDRGEKMGLKHTPRDRDTKPGNKRKLEHGCKKHNDRKDFKRKKICVGNIETEIKNKQRNIKNTIEYLPPAEDKKITPFSGIQELIISTQAADVVEDTHSNLLIEDVDHEINSQETSNSGEPVLCGALVSLMCHYGSSDEENDSQNTLQATTKLKGTNISQNSSVNSLCKENKKNEIPELSSKCIISAINDDNDSGPEEAKVVKNYDTKCNETSQKENTKQIKKKQHDKKENKQLNYRKPKSKLPSTLLQKLLFKEMQYERNMVLQCIRYIIKNNYFEK